MADSDLSRTHPLTVITRSARNAGQGLVALVTLTVFGALRGDAFALAGITGLLLLGIGVATAFSWLNWLFFRYGIVGDDLIIEEGWIVKTRRSIPLARVQGVDIRAGVLARVLGLADVMVQTAGGGEGSAEALIGAIPLGDAESLRARLINRPAAPTEATHETNTTGAAEPPGPEQAAPVGTDPLNRMSDLRGAFGGAPHSESAPVFEHKVAVNRLILAGLTSNGPALAWAATVGLAANAVELVDLGRIDSLATALASLGLFALMVAGLGVFVLVAVLAVAITVARDFGFTIRRTDDRLETEAGLFERRMTSVPVRRIQAVVIEASPIRRMLGLAAVTIDTAGFGRTEGQQVGTSAAIVPLARASEIRLLLHSLLWEAEHFALVRALSARALRFYVLAPSVSAAVLTGLVFGVPLMMVAGNPAFDAVRATAPISIAVTVTMVTLVVAGARALRWRAAGYGVEADALVVQWGALGLRKVRLSRSRIQSLSVRQGFFQHRAGLATLQVTSVSGASRRVFRVQHLPLAEAARIESWYSPGL